MTDRFTPHAAALVLLIRDDQVLLLRRANTGWADGMYTLPSGHVEADESVVVAAARELSEEVGVTASVDDLAFAHVMYRRNAEGRVYADFFFVCSQWSGEPIVNEPDKCDEVRWCPIDELPDTTVEFVRVAIDHYRQGVTFSEHGWS